MDFLKTNRFFSFSYGDTPFSALQAETLQTENGNTLTTVYKLADGLQVTTVAKKHGAAYEWVTWFENTADVPSKIISALYDTDITLPMPHEEPLGATSYQPSFEESTAIFVPKGSRLSYDEFTSFADRKEYNAYLGHIPPNSSKFYACTGGRSSDGYAPFFNIHKGGKGYIFAIGWTGQWNCHVTRTEDEILIKAGLEDTHFRLLPGEKIRTSSFVLMPYEGSVIESQNIWRRLVKENFSLIGSAGRETQGPLCATFWGGMKSENILERIKVLKENGLPFEYVWLDAGWYGKNTEPTPDEFEGDWGYHIGDWQVSPLCHPNLLKDVSQAIHQAGMKFLLWFEIERSQKGTPTVTAHPEYFIFPESEQDINVLLNLGDNNAWNYAFETLSSIIEATGIDCYRQDFNVETLHYWRKNDSPDRKGITEIKHVMGLYRLWDALLEKFPHLIIDNCASGGRRIDIETLRRSIPLWRSDYQCPANHPSEGSQCHNLGFSSWMPFSGTGTGRAYDTYRYRSGYGPALAVQCGYSEREAFGEDFEKMQWLKGILEEYLSVRPYMSEDFYPLTEVSDRKDVWCAAQFDRPEKNDGIVQLFRRENSPYETAIFNLFAVDKTAIYCFTDADTKEQRMISGAELAEKGFEIRLKEKRSSKIYFYKKTV